MRLILHDNRKRLLQGYAFINYCKFAQTIYSITINAILNAEIWPTGFFHSRRKMVYVIQVTFLTEYIMSHSVEFIYPETFLTLQKSRFRIWRRFWMVEYIENVNTPLSQSVDCSASFELFYGRTCLFYWPVKWNDLVIRDRVENQCYN